MTPEGFLSRLNAWRAKPHEQQIAELSGLGGSFVPRQDNSGRVRLGILSPCLINGGTESWALMLARSIDSERIVLSGLVVSDGARVDEGMKSKFLEVLPVGIGRTHARTLAAHSDVLVTVGWHDLPGLVSGLDHPPKTIAVSHAPGEWAWGRTACGNASPDQFVAVSNSALECVPEKYRSKAIVIPNAVDPRHLDSTRTRDEVRKSWKVSNTDYVVGYLGRLSSEKNPLVMVSLARLAPVVKVVVVGAGVLFKEMEKESRGFDNVRLVGVDDRAGDVLRAFDALVVPSDFESYGLSIVEGLAVGCPVISTCVGVAKENPGLTRLSEATGEALYAAVNEDRRDWEGTRKRIEVGIQWVAANASMDIFGRSWSDYLVGLSPPPAASPPEPPKPSRGCGCGNGRPTSHQKSR